ncbi:MAG: ABC-F family ATP-binding cassette domain-containing protein [Eggerthellaceae bacterium]|jgi:ATPase subunit of ABC transporter with duplicated ATPase domains|nr:ABC-F family ATP-binding cassette domain-containing protein [Eggerthellaceae bacterium]
MLTCKDIALDYPTKHVFDSVTLGVNSGDRIGIVGRNGDGKSSLLHVLARRVKPEHGNVIPSGNATVGILDQRDNFDDADSIRSILGGDDAYLWESDRRARSVVTTLLYDLDPDSTIGELSGGQRRRVDLARLLIGDWDILMLDEPTNHLDLDGITWLADHLKHRWQKNAGALLVVTHDRWFLDEVCEHMWEVHDGQVEPFDGGYSAYIMQRVERERQAHVAAQKRNNQLRKELAWLSRGARARSSKPRFHVEAAQNLIADVPPVRNTLELKQMAMSRLGKQVIELHDVCFQRGKKSILKDITWTIGAGDRIGILGANGAGKTTLMRILNGTLKPTEGHVKIGKTVQYATLSQNLDELAPHEEDRVRNLLSNYRTFYIVDGERLSPTTLLERLGFSHDQINARVKDLSGGQRRRLEFLLVLLGEPNVLLLDEPGNDMDTDMLTLMEDLLDSWPGTLIIISHDRHLVERVTDTQYALIDGIVQHVPGGIDEYLRLEQSRLSKEEQAQSTAHTKDSSANESEKPHVTLETDNGASPPLSHADRYRIKKEQSSIERKMDTQRTRLQKAEDVLNQADPFNYEKLCDAQSDVQKIRDTLEQLEDRWLEISEILEG